MRVVSCEQCGTSTERPATEGIVAKDAVWFGPWVYDEGRFCLIHEIGEVREYDVSLARLTSHGEVLDAILHVSAKKWVTAETVGHLVRGIQYVLGVRGGAETFDPRVVASTEAQLRRELQRMVGRNEQDDNQD